MGTREKQQWGKRLGWQEEDELWVGGAGLI